MKTLKIFFILITAVAMMSCSKDDDDDYNIPEIQGIHISQIVKNGVSGIEIQWDNYAGAEEYVIYAITEEKNYQFTTDSPNDEIYAPLEYGTVIQVEAYSGSKLIAKAEIIYDEDSDGVDNNDDNPDDNTGDNPDDNTGGTEVGTIEGISTMDNHGTFLIWTAYTNAKEYYVYVNGEKISDIPYTSTQASLNNVSAGDKIEIKAYSDFDEEELIATGSYTYEDSSDEEDNDSDEFSIYNVSYYDKIKYDGEDESFSDNTKYKKWILTSSTHSNLKIVISVSSANSNGEQIKNATYNLGKSSDYASGGASAIIVDSDQTDGWSLKYLTNGTMKVEGSTSSGCTITFSNAYSNVDSEYSFSGTSTVEF